MEKRWEDGIWSMKYVAFMRTLTKIFLLIKAGQIGRYFGSNDGFMDYDLVFARIGLLAVVLSNSLLMALIWNYRLVYEIRGGEFLFDYISSMFNLVLVLVGTGITIFMGLVYGDIIKFRNAELKFYVLVFSPVVLWTCLKVTLTAYLQMTHGFFAGNRGNLLRSIIYVLALGYFKDGMGLKALIILGLVTNMMQFAIVYQRIVGKGFVHKRGLRIYPWTRGAFSSGLRNLILLILYNFALFWRQKNIITIFLINIIFEAVVTVIYPVLTEDYIRYRLGKDRDLEVFNYNLARTFSLYLRVLIPFMVLMFFQSDNVKALLDIRRSNDLNILFQSGLGIIAISVFPMMIRIFLAVEDYLRAFGVMLVTFVVGGVLFMVNGNGRIAFDSSLFSSCVLGLIFINERVDFLGSEVFKSENLTIIRPSIWTLAFNWILSFLYSKFYAPTGQLTCFILALVGSILVFSLAYRYEGERESQELEQKA